MMLKEVLKNKEIILASGSPRRHQFFMELGIPFKIDARPVKEVYPNTLKAEEITNYLSQLKAEAFRGEIEQNQLLITSDTIVSHAGRALGKPKDKAEAHSMLQSLSGKTHEVITSVCFTSSKAQETLFSKTRVVFRELKKEEIEYYINTFQPYDKAGGYAIQEWIGLVGITRIEGSYANVVGLPTHLVYQKLLEFSKQL